MSELAKLANHMLEYTIFFFKITPGDNLLALTFWSVVNTTIRFGGLYLLIRVVMTSINHGSF